MATYGFGSGVVWGTPLTDAFGNVIANPSPTMFGTLQDVSIDISGENKELYGMNTFPERVARGKTKVTGKAKFARFNGLLLNNLFFGQTMTSGVLGKLADFTGEAIPATPFTLTVSPPSTGTFAADLGVRDWNGNPMVAVAASPTTGQYTVNTSTGAYLFAAADTGKTVFISYAYGAASTLAKMSTVMNIQMGSAPTFRLDLVNGLSGNNFSLTLFSCIASKLSLATKIDDFDVQEFDFSAFADSTNRVLTWGTSE